MATNGLTPEQDLLVREFYVNIATKAEGLLPNAPAYGRQLRAICLLLLNYDQLRSGAFITKGQTISVAFGSTDYSAYKDEWQDDYDRAVRAIAEGVVDETNNDQDTSEAGASEPSKDTEVR